MILFAVYAALVWYAAYRFRRTALGVTAAIASALPPIALTAAVSYLNRNPQDTGLFFLNNLKGYGVVLHIFTVPYALVVTGVALIAAAQRRDRPHLVCPRCHYDLEGNTSGQCPECGHMLPPDFIHAIARMPERHQPLTLPSFASDEDAARAGEESVRRITLPEHLVHDDNAHHHDVLKHGAQRARPHATKNRAPAAQDPSA